MAKTKKSLSEKERDLICIISDAKKKLAKLQSKQQMVIGELACKNGLNQFDLAVLDLAFNELAVKLKEGN